MGQRSNDPGHRAGWCIHYRYDRSVVRVADGTCEAGVRYGDIAGHENGIFARLPCFLNDDGSPKHEGAMPCASLRIPTKEEIAASEAWEEEHMALMAKVMIGIRPWRAAHKGKSAQEVVECPGCAGRLHLSISAYNGHVHGKCETQHCVDWME